MKEILDACCGSKMFYFNKNNKNVLFMDKRELHTTLCDGRKLDIEPDLIADFTKIPFENESFNLVVFDPPHLEKVGDKSWLAIKYGKLTGDWRSELKKGFDECYRVLKSGGTLLFKWNETDTKVSEMIKLFEKEPLLYNKKDKTHWIVYYKELKQDDGFNRTMEKRRTASRRILLLHNNIFSDCSYSKFYQRCSKFPRFQRNCCRSPRTSAKL